MSMAVDCFPTIFGSHHLTSYSPDTLPVSFRKGFIARCFFWVRRNDRFLVLLLSIAGWRGLTLVNVQRLRPRTENIRCGTAGDYAEYSDEPDELC